MTVAGVNFQDLLHMLLLHPGLKRFAFIIENVWFIINRESEFNIKKFSCHYFH